MISSCQGSRPGKIEHWPSAKPLCSLRLAAVSLSRGGSVGWNSERSAFCDRTTSPHPNELWRETRHLAHVIGPSSAVTSYCQNFGRQSVACSPVVVITSDPPPLRCSPPAVSRSSRAISRLKQFFPVAS